MAATLISSAGVNVRWGEGGLWGHELGTTTRGDRLRLRILRAKRGELRCGQPPAGSTRGCPGRDRAADAGLWESSPAPGR